MSENKKPIINKRYTIKISDNEVEIYDDGKLIETILSTSWDNLLIQTAKSILILAKDWSKTLDEIDRWVQFQKQRLSNSQPER